MTTIPNIELPDYASEPEEKHETSPLEILDGYAERLVNQTGGHVRGQVYVAPFLGLTRYTFYLLVPAINDYTDPLFYVWNKKASADYPVEMLESGARQEDANVCGNAAELTELLNRLFASAAAKSRIRRWIELAKDRTPVESR